MKKYAVIVAGGSGQRMGSTTPKQFLTLSGRPVLWYTLTSFLKAFDDLQVILVLPSAHLPTGQEIVKTLENNQRVSFCEGGETRFQSVKNGLKHVPEHAVVFIHDGVRCLVSDELIRRCYEATMIHGNAVPAIVPADSIRIENNSTNTVLDRNLVRLIQTPQTFKIETIRAAFEQEYNDSFSDEATVLESMGGQIFLVEGERTNLKITHPVDLLFAEQIINSKS
ncbi:MAG: 2-C-methyl-D-erythritol 4-phosphate cytidylyltransferase [Chitinophagaceae bacterium]|nr:MAG: 2-C-methyl-D-erythritol 4-phosphate cytidylyltransferase [Chitinophagaceae bacterium]